MRGHGNGWVWYESGYGVVVFGEFVGQLTWDNWEVMLALLWFDISFVSGLLINVYIDNWVL